MRWVGRISSKIVDAAKGVAMPFLKSKKEETHRMAEVNRVNAQFC